MTAPPVNHDTIVLERIYDATPTACSRPLRAPRPACAGAFPRATSSSSMTRRTSASAGVDISRCGPRGNLIYRVETRYQDIVPEKRIISTEVVSRRRKPAVFRADHRRIPLPQAAAPRLILTDQVVAFGGASMIAGHRPAMPALSTDLAHELRREPADGNPDQTRGTRGLYWDFAHLTGGDAIPEEHMQLHCGVGPNSYRVRIFMAEKGIDVPRVEVDLIKGEHKSPEFLKLNSLGQIPVLVLDDGTVITESVAICRYLEEIHPEPRRCSAPMPSARARSRCGTAASKWRCSARSAMCPPHAGVLQGSAAAVSRLRRSAKAPGSEQMGMARPRNGRRPPLHRRRWFFWSPTSPPAVAAWLGEVFEHGAAGLPRM